MKKLLVFLGTISLMSLTEADKQIVGRWRFANGMIAEYRQDSIFNLSAGPSLIITGRYIVTGETLTYKKGFAMPDSTLLCDGLDGSYKITFIADTAVVFKAIADECNPRREMAAEAVLTRMK